ncbi:MAG: hypothetical protein KJ052_15685, partial [Candidatus Hydrogenedentes bacterium]|nr:hypothetical protein [Candidatus Hydrogenedentota bacterium]
VVERLGKTAASAEDFPAFWETAFETRELDLIRQEVKSPLASLERQVRLGTGIRPTPGRWRVWFGHRLLVADSSEGQGLCVYPGVLLRIGHALNTLASTSVDNQPIYQFGGYFYAWRQRYLIASQSLGYVEAALSAAPPVVELSRGPSEIRVQWTGQPEGAIRLRALDGFPVEGRLRLSTTNRELPLHLSNTSEWQPAIFLTTSSWQDARAVLDTAVRLASLSETGRRGLNLFIRPWESWQLGELPHDWDLGISQMTFALADVHFVDHAAVPVFAGTFRSERPIRGNHPLLPLTATLNTQPYEWHGEPGLRAPLWGDALALCLGHTEYSWHATTQEPLMEILTRGEPPSEPLPDDLILRWNWGKNARLLTRLLAEAAGNDRLGRNNNDDFERDVAPWLKALENMGWLELIGESESGWTTFRGVLNRGTPVRAESR